MSNVTNLNTETSKQTNEAIGNVVNSLIATSRKEMTPVEKGAMTGAVVGGGVGVAIGSAIGAAGGFMWQHKGKVAIAAAAVAAFVYREEITNFVTGIAGGESAGGDAFM